MLKAPPDIVVFRCSSHPNLKKVLVPCDLSVYTLMQIRTALHAFQGRPDVEYCFVHVSRQPEQAALKWSKMIDYFEFDQPPALKIIPTDKGAGAAEILLDEAGSG